MNATRIQITATEKDADKRLDLFLAEQTDRSRSQIQKLIKAGLATINGGPVKKVGERVSAGDIVALKKEVVKKAQTKKEAVKKIPPIPILKETDDYLVINKPAGLLVHPTDADEPNTLAAWLVKQYPKITSVGDRPDVRPGIVHRLDKDVSGVMVVAKTQKMYDHLKRQFKNRSVEKEYAALVYGAPEQDEGVIDFPIDRGKDGRMAARPKIERITLKTIRHIQPGKPAVTEFQVLKRFARYALLAVRIHTGRTHQIRVHLFASDHPIVGDPLYANNKLIKKNDTPLGRLFLHARKLCFKNIAGERVCFETELPRELEQFLSKIT